MDVWVMGQCRAPGVQDGSHADPGAAEVLGIGTGNRSASRAASQSFAAAPWHFGQWGLRQVMGVAHYLPYGQSR
ncbi:hypothetical protein CQ13_03500 [Bradyrhizobium retamae]|uniref:Uncharacterized protein n=1 Tax=Bradyrhizobium retamae TaxID=1300035 RepID=A0A0R3N5I6_9BRAD|nr:hypothetical protein CQ13_03500 [Bradyrhizobium retamae]